MKLRSDVPGPCASLFPAWALPRPRPSFFVPKLRRKGLIPRFILKRAEAQMLANLAMDFGSIVSAKYAVATMAAGW